MKKTLVARLTASVLALVMLLLTFGCGNSKNVDAEELFQSLLNNVSYESPLEDAGESGALYFRDMPDGAEIKFYAASGYIADKLVLITLDDKKDSDDAVKSVEAFVSELHNQFLSYAPDQAKKFDKAIIWTQNEYIILCVTNDAENAQAIIDGAAETPNGEEETETESQPLQTVGSESGYPVLKSADGTYYDYGNGVYRVGDTAFEVVHYDSDDAANYAKAINNAASAAKNSNIKVYTMIAPNAYGICFPDDLQSKVSSYLNQGETIRDIYKQIDDSVVKVECFDTLMKHRDEYLYFKSDFHWTGTAAYYAYETWCKAKGITPYTLSQREQKTFDGFLGALYNNSCNHDPQIASDTIYAYCPVNNIDMTITEASGNTFNWQVIYDVSDYPSNLKYSTFAGGDNALTVYKNPAVTDGSVCVFVKESYGNALVSYLVDHYSTLYEIDYRHWSGNIMSYASQVGAKDVLFVNNISMVRNTSLVAELTKDIG